VVASRANDRVMVPSNIVQYRDVTNEFETVRDMLHPLNSYTL